MLGSVGVAETTFAGGFPINNSTVLYIFILFHSSVSVITVIYLEKGIS
jgi:hypothetical protein